MIGKTLAHYRIDAELGRGGMGVVYKATDTRLNRPVALKFLPEDVARDPQALDRFHREARAASALNHPHVCTIHEIGEAEGHTYISMEYVEGHPLSESIPEHGLSPDGVIRCGAQIADALAHAHSRGVIHRDLKSQNILVNREGRVKLLDFGLAVRREPEIVSATRSQLSFTESGGAAGTLHYLSPEILRGEPATPQSDIWALGVVLYEMASGRLPFLGATGFAVSSAIIQEMPVLLPARVSPGLRAVVQRCLAKEPGQRYQQAGEVRAALEALASDSSPQVSPGIAGALPRGGQTRRTLFLLGSGALLALVVLLGWKMGWRWPGSRSTGETIQSLAILPLRPVGEQANGNLGTGIADTVITKVSQIGELTVRPSSAVRKYATQETDALEAARQLKVDAVLDGTVQRAGDRLRVNLNLLRVRDGASLWSETFNVTQADLFDMQDQIAQQVTAGLRLKLTPAEKTRMTKRYTASPQANEYFLRGMYNFDKRSLTRERRASLEAAIAMFKKAIELDPSYALAHAQLAYCYAWIALFIEPGPSWLEQAREELRRAEALDPDLAQIHVVRHELLWSYYEGFQLERSAQELRTALRLDPSVGHDPLGVLYAHMGLEEAALRELRRAIEIDPTSEINISRYVEGFDLLHRPDEAIAANKQFGELPGPSSYLRKSYLWKGQWDRAQRLEEAWGRNPQDPLMLSERALRLALQGEFRSFEAQIPAIVEKGQQSRAYHHMTYNVACVYALQGKAPQAVEWLQKTVDTGMPSYTLFARDPHLDRIRSSPEFASFMNGLKPRWEALQREFGSG